MAEDGPAEIRRHRQTTVGDEDLGQTQHHHLFFLTHSAFTNFPNVTLRGATVHLQILADRQDRVVILKEFTGW